MSSVGNSIRRGQGRRPTNPGRANWSQKIHRTLGGRLDAVMASVYGPAPDANRKVVPAKGRSSQFDPTLALFDSAITYDTMSRSVFLPSLWILLLSGSVSHAGDAIAGVLDQAVAVGWPDTRTAQIMVGRITASWDAKGSTEMPFSNAELLAGRVHGYREGIHLDLPGGGTLLTCETPLPKIVVIGSWAPVVPVANVSRAAAAKRWEVEPMPDFSKQLSEYFRPEDQAEALRLLMVLKIPENSWLNYGGGGPGLLLLRRAGVSGLDDAIRTFGVFCRSAMTVVCYRLREDSPDAPGSNTLSTPLRRSSGSLIPRSMSGWY